MKRNEHAGEGPNIAGVSLALYLLVSILSMMAAYEVGKAADDCRNSVVVSLHQSSHSTPGKSGDDGRDDPVVLVAFHPDFLDRPTRIERAASDQSSSSCIQRGFDARGPPHSSVPA
jgi:hypothetical protein